MIASQMRTMHTMHTMHTMQTMHTMTGPAVVAGPGRVRSNSSNSTKATLFVRPARAMTVVRAGDDGDADFEARLAALKKAKGETPYGESKSKEPSDAPSSKAKAALPTRDYTDETVYFESGPHMGDLAVNVALGTTLLWLPLSIAAVGRAAFVKYRFTDRRLSSITTAPWKTEQLDAAYEDVVDVKSIGRGVGYWGDMVVTLRNGDKVEMRALPKFRELQQYILDRRDALKKERGGGGKKERSPTAGSGF